MEESTIRRFEALFFEGIESEASNAMFLVTEFSASESAGTLVYMNARIACLFCGIKLFSGINFSFYGDRRILFCPCPSTPGPGASDYPI